MKNKACIIGLYIVLLAILFSPQLQSQTKKPPGGYKPDELVCRMKPGYDIEIINNAYGTVVKGHQSQTDCYLLMVTQGQNPESLAVVIDSRPDVQYCAANYFLVAPEPYQRSQPFLDLQGVGDFTTQLAAVNLDLDAVHLTTEGADVKVAVLDGGVNLDHPLFTAKGGEVVSGWDFIDGDSVAEDEEGGACSGHGTFVAGVIKLTAPESHIYAYRILDTAGTGDGYTIADAVFKAVKDSCRVINMSLGMIGVHDALDDAIRFARDNGVVVVAAAGNDSTDNIFLFPFPASKPYCLSVAALDSNNVKADFSNYGIKVDVCAPGTGIYGPYLDTLYGWWDGTSFATPFVTGLASLLFSVDPALTWENVFCIIKQTAINIDSLNPGLTGLLGTGMIDMAAALDMISSYEIGDVNRDEVLNILDITYIVSYLYKDGPQPIPLEAADIDGSETINLLDATYLINYLYKEGPPPVTD